MSPSSDEEPFFGGMVSFALFASPADNYTS